MNNVIPITAARARRTGQRASDMRPRRVCAELGPFGLQRIDAMQREHRLRMDRAANAAGLCPTCRQPVDGVEHFFAIDEACVVKHVECGEAGR
jgi:hypothetical protein